MGEDAALRIFAKGLADIALGGVVVASCSDTVWFGR